MMDYGLNPDEAHELQGQLDAGEWEALLQVQRQLLDAPMLAPSVGFADRVLAELAVRERQQARWRNTVGATAFAFGTLVVLGLTVCSTSFGLLTQVNGWAGLLNAALSFIGLCSTLFLIASTFAEALLRTVGGMSLLLLAFFALALTLLWTRVVAGNAPLTRPNLV